MEFMYGVLLQAQYWIFILNVFNSFLYILFFCSNLIFFYSRTIQRRKKYFLTHPVVNRSLAKSPLEVSLLNSFKAFCTFSHAKIFATTKNPASAAKIILSTTIERNCTIFFFLLPQKSSNAIELNYGYFLIIIIFFLLLKFKQRLISFEDPSAQHNVFN